MKLYYFDHSFLEGSCKHCLTKIFLYSLQNEYLVSYLDSTLYFLYLVVTLFGVCGLVINVELAAYESILHLSPTDARKSVLAKVCGCILFIKFNILYTGYEIFL